MTVTEQTIRVPMPGLDRPVTVCQITDSHVSLADERDDDQYNAHARVRDGMFSNGHPGALEAALLDMIDRARDADAVVLTGDIIDFPSRANLDFLSRAFTHVSPPCLYIFGNHDYRAPWMTDEEAAEARDLFSALPGLHNAPDYAVLDVHGLRLIGLDDSQCQVSPEHLSALTRDLAPGGPSALFVHAPLYAPTLYEPDINFWRTCGEMGFPAHLFPEQADKSDLRLAAPATRDALTLLRTSPGLHAVVAGHLHFTHDDPLWPGATQYTCANGAMGFMRRLVFTP